MSTQTIDTLTADLIALRDAADELAQHIDVLLATGNAPSFSASCGVMNQLTDAMRFVKFRGRNAQAEGADALVM